MRLTGLLAATCSILALVGCGTTESSGPAGGTPSAGGTAVADTKSTTEATRPATEDTSQAPPRSDETSVDHAQASASGTPTIQGIPVPTARQATAPARLTDQEVRTLLEGIERKRSAFEAALDSQLKNSTIRTERGQVNTNEFFDDFQDQVQRARERFSSTYSASSEVLSLLQFTARLEAWASTQPAEFQGSREWAVLATDVRRLAAAYNSGLLRPGQPALGPQARRLNDAELVTAVANIEKNMDAFRSAYASALAANTNLTSANRQSAIQPVDAMKNSARALHTALDSKQKGVAEANALLRGSAAMADATRNLPPNSSAAAAWAPVREELSKAALGYEVLLTEPATLTTQGTGTSTATASARLADQEVRTLLEGIEQKRSAFEAALDSQLKNSTIRTERGQVNTNEFFDDLQDQVRRARERFSSTYSASSEVLSLLQFAARLEAWASTQPAEFQGSREWAVLATDVRRLAAAYNSGLLRPGQPALGPQARRLNDAELVTAVANIEKNMDAFRSAYASALAANTNLTSANRQSAIQPVDAMKNSARALHTALDSKQKGVAEANALLRGSAAMAGATRKLPPNSSAAAAWAPVREELSKVALAYEVTLSR